MLNRGVWWIVALGAGLLGMQLLGWLYLIATDLEREEMRMETGLLRTCRALRSDADCVQLFTRLETDHGRPFHMVRPSVPGRDDTVRTYSQKPDLSDTIAHPGIFHVDRHAFIDVTLKWRFTEHDTSLLDHEVPLRYAFEDTMLYAIRGKVRLSLFTKVKLEALLHEHLLQGTYSTVEYAVVDTILREVIMTNTSRRAMDVMRTGFHESVYGREDGVAPLAILVDVPDRRAVVRSERLAWLAVPVLLTLGLVTLLVLRDRTMRERQRLAQMQMDLISNITHELNTPIANITLALETLRRNVSVGSGISHEQVWEIVNVENQRLRSSISKVLDVSFLDGKQLLLQPEVHDLHALIMRAVHGFALVMEQQHISLDLQLEADRSWVKVDGTYIANAFQALLDNAIKHGGEACHIVIRTADKERGVLVTFGDNGPGIPRSERELVFEKFYRVRQEDRHEVKGTGIGLYYVRQVIEAHGGRVHIAEQERGVLVEVFIQTDIGDHGQTAHR